MNYLNKTILQVENFAIKQVARRRKITSFWKVTLQRLKQGKYVRFAISAPHIALNLMIELWMDIKFFYSLKKST